MKPPSTRARRVLAAASMVVVIVAAWTVMRGAGNAAAGVPTAEVRKAEFVDFLEVRGEVKAVKTTILSAPAGAGDPQILKLARNGSTVEAGQPVIEFDASTMRRNLERKRSEMAAAEAEIERTRAQARMRQEELDTELSSARYAVERARLDLQRQEILSAIESDKAAIVLNNAEQRLREVEEKVTSGRKANQADIEIRRQKREKVLYDVRELERQIASLTLKAPLGGIVTLLPNFRARGFGGGAAVPPPFKEGDRAWPGAGIAELPELSAMRMSARVDETDRGRLKVGHIARIRVDALPDKEFEGKVVEISPLAKVDFSGWPPTKNFDVVVEIGERDERLRPGMSSTARVAVESVPEAILIPSGAIFERAGRTVAFVQRGSRFEERAVQVGRRGKADGVILGGLQPGEKVALKDPQAEQTP